MDYTTRILIADENATGRAMLKDALARTGYRVIDEASNGDDALQKIE